MCDERAGVWLGALPGTGQRAPLEGITGSGPQPLHRPSDCAVWRRMVFCGAVVCGAVFSGAGWGLVG
jgi:hypothetical protein